MSEKPIAQHILKVEGNAAAQLAEMAVFEDRTLTAQVRHLIREGHRRFIQQQQQQQEEQD